MNLASDLLSVGAPTATAIYAGSVDVTYRELREAVERTTRMLLARGCRVGDRVAT